MEQQKISVMYIVTCYMLGRLFAIEASSNNQALRKFIDYLNEHKDEYESVFSVFGDDRIKLLTKTDNVVKSLNIRVFSVEDPKVNRDWIINAAIAGSSPKVWATSNGLRVGKFTIKEGIVIL